LLGAEIISDLDTKAPGEELGQKITERAMLLGLSCNIVTFKGLGSVLRIAPPVTVTAGEIEEGLRILDEAFRDALNEPGVRTGQN
jgi:4-aminobutyrate aminotransferase-like enzyme